MKTGVALRALLREFETPQMVATHLGVSVQAVHSQMRISHIRQNQVERRRIVQQIREERPGMGIRDIAMLTKISLYSLKDALRDPSSDDERSSNVHYDSDSAESVVEDGPVALAPLLVTFLTDDGREL